jgi:hypothetical protein
LVPRIISLFASRAGINRLTVDTGSWVIAAVKQNTRPSIYQKSRFVILPGIDLQFAAAGAALYCQCTHGMHRRLDAGMYCPASGSPKMLFVW